MKSWIPAFAALSNLQLSCDIFWIVKGMSLHKVNALLLVCHMRMQGGWRNHTDLLHGISLGFTSCSWSGVGYAGYASRPPWRRMKLVENAAFGAAAVSCHGICQRLRRLRSWFPKSQKPWSTASAALLNLEHARQTKLRSAKFWCSLFSCSCLLKHDKRLTKVLSRLNGSKQTRKEEFFRLIDFQIPDLVFFCVTIAVCMVASASASSTRDRTSMTPRENPAAAAAAEASAVMSYGRTTCSVLSADTRSGSTWSTCCSVKFINWESPHVASDVATSTRAPKQETRSASLCTVLL